MKDKAMELRAEAFVKEVKQPDPVSEMIDLIINFQFYLNNKGLITNHDWDYEKVAKKFIKNRCHAKGV